MRYQIRKIAILFFSISFLFGAEFAQACSLSGSTVVYINGVNTTLKEAERDLNTLKEEYRRKTKDYQVTFLKGYNESHLDGLGDYAKTFWQDGFPESYSWMDYDLQTILLNLYKDLKTQKVLFVGHSQGTYYSNEAYQYLTEHGADKTAVGVFNVATPARFVAGGGSYLNSSNDSLLNWLEGTHFFKPLYRNISITSQVEEESIELLVDDALKQFPGHSFGGAYLSLAPGTLLGNVEKGLSKLSATSAKEECFTPPTDDLVYKAKGAVLKVADTVAPVAKDVTVAGVETAVAAAKTVYGATASALGWTVGLFIPETRTENLPGSFTVVKSLYGSSLTEEEVEEILGDQGGAVALAVEDKKEPPKQEGIVAGVETEEAAVPLPSLQPVPISPGFGGGGTPNAQTVSSPAPTVAEEEEELLPPTIDGVVIAEQPDASVSCAWRSCFTFNGEEGADAFFDLGDGSDLKENILTSVTIAKDENDPFVTHPWLIFVYCFSDLDNGVLCDDWGPEHFVISAFATTTTNNKYWTAYFTDAPAFVPGYFYRLVVNDDGVVAGAYGNAENEFYFVARGKSAPDVTPPSVVSFSPANASTEVPLNAQITITFSEPILSSSLDALAVTLQNYSTSNFEAATLSLDPSGLVVTITPENLLAPNSIYGPVVTNHIADLAGNHPLVNLLDGGESAHFFTVGEELEESIEDEQVEPVNE